MNGGIMFNWFWQGRFSSSRFLFKQHLRFILTNAKKNFVPTKGFVYAAEMWMVIVSGWNFYIFSCVHKSCNNSIEGIKSHVISLYIWCPYYNHHHHPPLRRRKKFYRIFYSNFNTRWRKTKKIWCLQGTAHKKAKND